MANKFIDMLKKNWLGGISLPILLWVLGTTFKINIPYLSDFFSYISKILGNTFCGGGWFACLGRDIFITASILYIVGAFIQSKFFRRR